MVRQFTNGAVDQGLHVQFNAHFLHVQDYNSLTEMFESTVKLCYLVKPVTSVLCSSSPISFAKPITVTFNDHHSLYVQEDEPRR